MAWTPISNTVPQYEEDGVAASGFYIKFYEAGTTTPTAMATDSTGATTLDKCELNTEGYPKNGSNAVFIPHIDRRYKIALFRNATDADNNNLNNAVWPVDNMEPVLTKGSGEVATIADLRNVEPTQDGQQISLLGHTLPGIGGGEFYYDASDTTSADNNGTIIVTTGGKRWKRSEVLYSAPSWFGFIEGGALATNTIAFQECINTSSVVSLKDGRLYEIDTLTLHSNLTIIGDPSSKIKCRNGISSTSLTNIRFLSVNFEYGGVVGLGLNIIEMTSCTDVWIDRCIIDGLGYSGDVPLTTGANIGIRLNACSNIKITNNNIGNMKNNWGVNLIDCINVDVDKNYVHHTGRAGVSVDNGNSEVRVTSNNLYLCKTNHLNVAAFDGCIDVYGPNNNGVVIHGNTIRDGGGTGTSGSGTPTPCTGIRIHGSFNVDVANNVIETGVGTHTVFGVQSRDGIDPSSIDIHDNLMIVTGPVEYGLRVLVCTDIKFNNNISRAEDATGLYQTNIVEFRNDAENIQIQDNIFEGFEGGLATINAISGIRFNSSGTLFSNIVVSGNVIKADSTGVSISNCDMFTIANNIIEYDQSASGISAAATTSNGIIISNCIKRPINPNISIDAGATNVLEANNILAVGAVP